MADPVPTTADEFIEQELNRRLSTIEGAFKADGLCLVGPLVFGVDELIRTMVEDLRLRQEPRRDRLTVILTTNGGYIEAVQRIVDILRHHYDHVAFVIPSQAFSAGTVLAMSGDEIYMDYYSRLGPIDPQVETARGRPVPALGYLKQWERLLKKDREGALTEAEVALMIHGFDQAELYKYEQARELSIALLKQWLVNYKFKNWTQTEGSQQPVTRIRRMRRAVTIARQLNNTDRWHSHGYGISMEELRRDIKLKIDDLDCNETKCQAVKEYDHLLSDYMTKVGISGIIHRVGKFVPTFGRS